MHPENKEKLDALKAFIKAFKIRIEENKSPYDSKFVEKLNRSDKDFNAGNFAAIKTEDLWK